MSDFGADQIRLAEAIERSVAHLTAACELYGAGRKPDALLQAARPITDVLPWLETELRSADEQFQDFYRSVAAVGSALRANESPRSVRKLLRRAHKAGNQLWATAVGERSGSAGVRFGASVAVALLAEVGTRYRSAITDEDLGEYHAAAGMAAAAVELFDDLSDRRSQELNRLLAGVTALLPVLGPPEKLAAPDDLEKLLGEIAAVAERDLGALPVMWTLADSIGRIERLLGDVADAYEKDLGPLAARLAASLFVRAYDPVRRDIAAVDPDAEARLTSLLGFELRRAINETAPRERIQELAAEATSLLATLRTQPAT